MWEMAQTDVFRICSGFVPLFSPKIITHCQSVFIHGALNIYTPSTGSHHWLPVMRLENAEKPDGVSPDDGEMRPVS